MLDWPTTSSYPTGYLRADGSAVSRTSYADLFSLIGTTYGSGDGSTTFNLPNLVAAGTGSPVKIIKASLGGTVEPSTVAHASSHTAGGSDVISIKQSQINDFVFTTEAARDAAITSPTEGMRAYITAPTIPATTGSGTGNLPTGIQTIYNGSVWVCITPVGLGSTNNHTVTASSPTNFLSSSAPLTITLVTGTTALISIKGRGTYSNGAYVFVGLKSTTVNLSDGVTVQFLATSTAGPINGTYLMTSLTAGTNTFTLQGWTHNGTTISMDAIYLTVQGVA